MRDSIGLGLNGLSIPAGTHICAFFRGIPDRDQIMVPFLREGLRAGDKCMCIIDDEAELNRFLPRYPQVIMCLYDLDHFGGEILVDILKTHPKMLMGGTVLENLYYLEPDEFLASRR